MQRWAQCDKTKLTHTVTVMITIYDQEKIVQAYQPTTYVLSLRTCKQPLANTSLSLGNALKFSQNSTRLTYYP